MAEVGFARFSAREVAKRIGYSIGTLYNVFGSYDRLMLAINTRTFILWAAHMRRALVAHPAQSDDRIATMVNGYFDFAQANTNAWMAIYDHRLPPDVTLPDDLDAQRSALTEIIVTEIAAVLPPTTAYNAPRLARSLVALVHGHCTFTLNGSFALMGEHAPRAMALDRVREVLRAAGASV